MQTQSQGALIIPPDFNSWPREKQIRHYLDLGLRIQPLYPYDDTTVKHPGKQPRLTTEQRLAWTSKQLIEHFRSHPTDNIGMIPMTPNIAIDLDDKSDGKSLQFF